MFETAILANAPAGRRAWSTCAGITAQAALVGCAILIPMLWPEAMPQPQTWLSIWLPTSPPPPPPRPAPAPRAVRTVATRVFNDGKIHIPTAIPEHVAMIIDPAPVAASTGIGVPGGVAGGQEGGVPGGVLNSLLNSARFTPAPVVAAPAATKPAEAAVDKPIPRVKMGGQVKPAVPIVRVEPIYPAMARQMRISGTVEITGVIGIDGHMREVRVVRGHPLLVNAALDAVRQWIYAPTTLNGEPVEVIAPITVTFRLN